MSADAPIHRRCGHPHARMLLDLIRPTAGSAVLLGPAIVLTAIAAVQFGRRDLRN